MFQTGTCNVAGHTNLSRKKRREPQPFFCILDIKRINFCAISSHSFLGHLLPLNSFTKTRRLCALRTFVCVWLLPMPSASTVLMRQLVELQANPPNGFAVRGIAHDNIFKWHVIVFGPIDTLYEGGTFLAQLDFPSDFPQRPPKMRFLSDVLHPNIFKDGHVCISILHKPGDDPFGEEKAAERWQPTLTVESIVISVQSMLSTPNFQSPANLDAALMFRTDILGYNDRVRQCVKKSNEVFEAEEHRYINYDGDWHVEEEEHRQNNNEEHRHIITDYSVWAMWQMPGEPRQNNNDGGAERAIEAEEQRPNLVNFVGFMMPVYEPRQNNNDGGAGRAIEAEENRQNEEEEDYVMGPLFGAEEHRQNNDDEGGN
uniref:UBIQUITIN_CONJUGAT_2 domain-containing protein n=1 Tax=Globodera pallida TaxID=36090 RepID=A0A183BVF3_GLOPA